MAERILWIKILQCSVTRWILSRNNINEQFSWSFRRDYLINWLIEIMEAWKFFTDINRAITNASRIIGCSGRQIITFDHLHIEWFRAERRAKNSIERPMNSGKWIQTKNPKFLFQKTLFNFSITMMGTGNDLGMFEIEMSDSFYWALMFSVHWF